MSSPSSVLVCRNSIFVPDHVRDAVKSAREEPFEQLLRAPEGARLAALLPDGLDRMMRSDYGRRLMANRLWRLGNLYYFPHIEDKSDVNVDWSEPHLIKLYNYLFGGESTTLNVSILKTRQVMVTTAVCNIMIDLCAFSPNQLCGISNFSEDDVVNTLRDKVYYCHEHSPILIRQRVRQGGKRLIFPRTSSELQVEQYGVGRTMSFMLLTEFAKTAEADEHKANEMLRGSGAAAEFSPRILESSSRGPGGKFYEICRTSQGLQKSGVPLDRTQFNFIFVPWWSKKRNRMDYTSHANDLDTYSSYFDELERQEETKIDPQQRNWWVSTLHGHAANDIRLMRQEYPGSVDEAFRANSDAYVMLAAADTMLADGRYLPLAITDEPLVCVWDFGWNDSTAFALFQQGPGGYIHCVQAYRRNREQLQHFFQIIRGLNLNIAWHVLPHDAGVGDSKVAQQITETRGSINSFFSQSGFRNTHQLRRLTEKGRGFIASKQFAPNVRICSHRAREMYESLCAVERKFNRSLGVYEDKLKPHSESNHLYDCFEAAAILNVENPQLFSYRAPSQDISRDAASLEQGGEEPAHHFYTP